MTLDASGNLLVGTTTIGAGNRMNVVGNNVVFSPNTAAKETHTFSTAAADVGTYTIKNDTTINVKLHAGGDSYFNGGNLLVGTATSASSRLCLEYAGATLLGQNINDSDNTANSTLMQFQIQGTQVGTIKRVASTSAVIYNTSSDYRLKTVTGSVTGQGARIDALKPIDYQWKEGNTPARGFLAHEFQTVYPSSVSGDKDAVDADGKPVYQAMQASTSEVIADLVAELQSLRARVAQLESKP